MTTYRYTLINGVPSEPYPTIRAACLAALEAAQATEACDVAISTMGAPIVSVRYIDNGRWYPWRLLVSRGGRVGLYTYEASLNEALCRAVAALEAALEASP